jgi:hypothetical protein
MNLYEIMTHYFSFLTDHSFQISVFQRRPDKGIVFGKLVSDVNWGE